MPNRICSVDGCGRPHKANGLCNTHNQRILRGKSLTPPVRKVEQNGICKVEGCGRSRNYVGPGGGKIGSADYCPMHKMRTVRHGDPGDGDRQRAPKSRTGIEKRRTRSPNGAPVWNTREYRRLYKLRLDYGMTPDDFDRIIESQESGCAICRAPIALDNCHVDHDHSAGHVRGLLCQRCNMGLGLFKDNPEILAAAARYIQMRARP